MPIDYIEDYYKQVSLVIPTYLIFMHPELYGKKIDDLEHLMMLCAMNKSHVIYEEFEQSISPELIRPTQESVYSRGLEYFIDNDWQTLPYLARAGNDREWCVMDGHHRIAAHIIKFGREPVLARCRVFRDGSIL